MQSQRGPIGVTLVSFLIVVLNAHAAHAVTAAISPPQALRPTVHFVPGLQQQFGQEPSTVGTLSTNLLGALVSKAIKPLGSDDLSKYVADNVAVGTSIPFDKHSRITAEVGLGLGEHVVSNKLIVWPFISMVQFDSTDSRLPRAIASAKPGQKTWSAPLLSIGFVFTKDYTKAIKEGKRLLPILSVGMRLPYYFPDDPFAGLAGLFSSRRNEFAKEGKPTFTLELAIPLRSSGDSGQKSSG